LSLMQQAKQAPVQVQPQPLMPARMHEFHAPNNTMQQYSGGYALPAPVSRSYYCRIHGQGTHSTSRCIAITGPRSNGSGPPPPFNQQQQGRGNATMEHLGQRTNNVRSVQEHDEPHRTVARVKATEIETREQSKQTCCVNGSQMMESLLDTGAEANMMKTGLAVRQGWPVQPLSKQTNLQTADGRKIAIDGTLQATVAVDGAQTRATFYVGPAVEPPIIISKETMGRLGMQLTGASGTQFLSHPEVSQPPTKSQSKRPSKSLCNRSVNHSGHCEPSKPSKPKRERSKCRSGNSTRATGTVIEVHDEQTRVKVMELHHVNLLNHAGWKRTYRHIRAIYSWPGIKSAVRHFCGQCAHCDYTRTNSRAGES